MEQDPKQKELQFLVRLSVNESVNEEHAMVALSSALRLLGVPHHVQAIFVSERHDTDEPLH